MAMMFPISTEKKQVIKASMGSDLRRLAVELPTNTTAAEAMAAVRAVVAHGFQLGREASSGLSIKYADEEGDLCTLTEHTLEDLVAMAGPKPWRLQVQQQVPLPVPCSSTAKVEESKAQSETKPVSSAAAVAIAIGESEGASETNAAAGAEGAEPGQSDDSKDGGEHAGLNDMQVGMALMFLPMAAGIAQSEQARARLNQAGVEERETFLPVCIQLSEYVEIVPESAHLKPLFDSYIEGTHQAEHLGDLAAALLQGWASAESNEAVKIVLQSLDLNALMAARQHVDLFGRRGKGKGKGKGKWKGKGQGKEHFWNVMQHQHQQQQQQ
mmetsp:Transcript_77103/g.216448  ORF Transcript_77103/g.216448 Transcript_77103/m.216448 type:complete len:326 (+) Transcript_77103:83-1060(+)